MANETDLVNAALAHIGHDPISSIDLQDNTVADQCRRLYPLSRDQALRVSFWNCATYRQILGLIDSQYTVRGSEWTHAYQLPTDPYCLRARRLLGTPYDDNARWHPELIPFRIEGRVLLCNVTTPTLIYTRKLDDVNFFDSALFNAVTVLLGSYLAIAVRKDYRQSTVLFNLWKELRDEAIGVDEAEGGRESYVSSDLLSSR